MATAVKPDPGTQATDAAVSDLEKKIKTVYRRAYNELRQTIIEFNQQHQVKSQEKLAKVQSGEMTQEAYNQWMAGQLFQGKMWQEKKEHLLSVVNNANQAATDLVNGGKTDVFITNANYQGYSIEQNLDASVSFSLYDANTVARLIKENPKLLPDKKLDPDKDKAWNNKKVTSAITQGILQGRTIPQIAQSLATSLAEQNQSAMVRTARTAMTSAQNAGRLEGMKQAEECGVHIKKQWLAASDDRVRETHAALNGQIADLDEPFQVDGMEIMYPGDPGADPSLVYNCRCTLKYVYPKYTKPGANDYYVDADGNHVPVNETTFAEWVALKEQESKNQELEQFKAGIDNLPHYQTTSPYFQEDYYKDNKLAIADAAAAKKALEIYGNMTDADDVKFIATTLDISVLKSEQGFINAETLKSLAESFWGQTISGLATDSDNGIRVIKYNGEYILLDGNHRANLAALQGQTQLEVMLYDWDAEKAAEKAAEEAKAIEEHHNELVTEYKGQDITAVYAEMKSSGFAEAQDFYDALIAIQHAHGFMFELDAWNAYINGGLDQNEVKQLNDLLDEYKSHQENIAFKAEHEETIKGYESKSINSMVIDMNSSGFADLKTFYNELSNIAGAHSTDISEIWKAYLDPNNALITKEEIKKLDALVADYKKFEAEEAKKKAEEEAKKKAEEEAKKQAEEAAKLAAQQAAAAAASAPAPASSTAPAVSHNDLMSMTSFGFISLAGAKLKLQDKSGADAVAAFDTFMKSYANAHGITVAASWKAYKQGNMDAAGEKELDKLIVKWYGAPTGVGTFASPGATAPMAPTATTPTAPAPTALVPPPEINGISVDTIQAKISAIDNPYYVGYQLMAIDVAAYKEYKDFLTNYLHSTGYTENALEAYKNGNLTADQMHKLEEWVAMTIPNTGDTKTHAVVYETIMDKKVTEFKNEIKAVNNKLSTDFGKALKEIGDELGVPAKEAFEKYKNDSLSPEQTKKLDELVKLYLDKKAAGETHTVKSKGSGGSASQSTVDPAELHKTFSGIWATDVTYADWADKKDKIQAKKDYFEQQIAIAQANGNTANEAKFKGLLAQLEEFAKHGEEYSKLLQAELAANAPKPSGGLKVITDAVRKAALRFRSREEADKTHRKFLDKIWPTLSDEQKYGIWEYTHNSNPMNKSLSGYHDSWSRSDHIGMDKTVWGHEDAWHRIDVKAFEKFAVSGHVSYHKAITACTQAIEKSALPEDTWLVRGSDNNGLAGLLEGNIISFEQAAQLLNGTSRDFETLRSMILNQTFTNHAFTSTGIANDSGFSGEVAYKILAPEGTKAIYAEPQSYYGSTSANAIYKPGKSYRSVGHEAEIIIQRGTTYRVADIQRSGGKTEITLEIVEQPSYFIHGDEDTYNNGRTRHRR